MWIYKQNIKKNKENLKVKQPEKKVNMTLTFYFMTLKLSLKSMFAELSIKNLKLSQKCEFT